MDTYLREFERALHLDPDETRAIVAEVRGNLEDMVAHLQAQGNAPDEAEEAAIHRFDGAASLARSMRYVHRRVPLPLRAVGMLLLVAGLAGLMLALNIGQTLMLVAHPAPGSLPSPLSLPSPSDPWFLQVLVGLCFTLWPIVSVVIGIIGSLLVAVLVLTGQRRRRWRRIGMGATVAGLFDGVVILTLWSTVPTAAQPFACTGPKCAIQHTALLATYGLVGSPAPGQPNRPATIVEVLATTTGTTVEYLYPNAIVDGAPNPVLFDDQGYRYKLANGSGGLSMAVGSEELMPWHPPVRGFTVFQPMRAAAHAAVIRFFRNKQVVEIIRVPLNLRVLRQLGHMRLPQTVARVHGVRPTLTTR